jgi:hypothetical protein
VIFLRKKDKAMNTRWIGAKTDVTVEEFLEEILDKVRQGQITAVANVAYSSVGGPRATVIGKAPANALISGLNAVKSEIRRSTQKRHKPKEVDAAMDDAIADRVEDWILAYVTAGEPQAWTAKYTADPLAELAKKDGVSQAKVDAVRDRFNYDFAYLVDAAETLDEVETTVTVARLRWFQLTRILIAGRN